MSDIIWVALQYLSVTVNVFWFPVLPISVLRIAEVTMSVLITFCSSGSLEIIKELSHKDSNVHFVSLSRNFGHQGALFAGMNYTRGNAVSTMANSILIDLENPVVLL